MHVAFFDRLSCRSLRGSRLRRSAHLHGGALDAHFVPGELLGEGRRACASFGKILIAVPRAGDAAVDDCAFADGAALVRAHVGDGVELAFMLENGDAFAIARAYDLRAVFDEVSCVGD